MATAWALDGNTALAAQRLLKDSARVQLAVVRAAHLWTSRQCHGTCLGARLSKKELTGELGIASAIANA
jgi:hypothetical protein